MLNRLMEDEAMDIINELVEKYNFELVLRDRNERSLCDWKTFLSDELPYEIRYGVTKIVIIPNNETSVIKIPFECQGVDHCKIEAANYRKAVESGMEVYFAQTKRAGTFDEVPIYISEQARCDEEFVNSAVRESLSEFSWEEIDELFSDDMAVAEEFLLWGLGEDFEKLSNFLSENEIYDIHSGNVGWIEGRGAVLIDYSGVLKW